MKRVIIAFANINSPKFNPTYAEFTVAESTLSDYLSGKDNKSLTLAARTMLGVDFADTCISGVFVDDPNGTKDIAEFFDGLKSRWKKHRMEAWGKSCPGAAAPAASERPTPKVEVSEVPPEAAEFLRALFGGL